MVQLAAQLEELLLQPLDLALLPFHDLQQPALVPERRYDLGLDALEPLCGSRLEAHAGVTVMPLVAGKVGTVGV